MANSGQPLAAHRLSTGLALWAFALSLCWLLPSFSPLWPSFDLELTCAAACTALAFGLAIASKKAWNVPHSALVVAALAAVPMLQFLSGKILFFGDSWMASLYLLGFALAIATGHRAKEVQNWTAAFFLAIVMASMVSVAIEFKQWLNIGGLDPWTRDLPPASRPFANLGQPNNLSTLLCWGLIGLWNAFLSKRASGRMTAGCAAYLLFGLALTQSRTAWLILACFVIVAFVFYRRLAVKSYQIPLLLLGGFFITVNLGLSVLGPALGREPPRTLQLQLEGGTRIAHWNSSIAAIGERFWTGWGWEQVSVAQQAMAPSLPAVPELLGYSHNLFLDLLIWNGVPLGAALIALILVWLALAVRRVESTTEILLLLAVVSVLVHSLLEYPHAYAFFLLPTGFMIGANSGLRSKPRRLLVTRPSALIFTCLLGFAAALTVVDYSRARANFDALRFEMARIGTGRNSAPPQLKVLTQLQAFATTDRMPIHANASDTEVALLSKVAKRFPAERTLMQYAAVSAGRGDYQEARTTLVRLCKLYPAERCAFAGSVWSNWSKTRYPWLGPVPFPVLSGID